MPPFPVYDISSSRIFSVNPDGSDLRQVSKSEAYSAQPSVSRDGKRIVFVGTSRVPTFAPTGKDLFVMTTDGRNERWLTHLNSNSDDYDPAISPDGHYVAFISTRDGNPDLYLGAVDNPSAPLFRITTTDSIMESSPTWSPNGSCLAYSARRDQYSPEDVWMVVSPLSPVLGLFVRVNLTDSVRVHDTSGQTRAYNNWQTPDWSPDGKLIAMRASYFGPLDVLVRPAVYVVSPVSYRATTIVSDSGVNKRQIDPYDPSWSPDGKRLVVASRTGAQSFQLDVYNSDGSWVNAINPPSNRRYWQPDWGTYAVRGIGDIEKMNLREY